MWVKLTDDMPWNPKLMGVSDAVFRMWVTGLCYANQHRTGGRLDRGAVRAIGEACGRSGRSTAQLIRWLLKAGLWERRDEPGVYWIHDYAEFQRAAMPNPFAPSKPSSLPPWPDESHPSKAGLREKWRERQRRWRARKKGLTGPSPEELQVYSHGNYPGIHPGCIPENIQVYAGNSAVRAREAEAREADIAEPVDNLARAILEVAEVFRRATGHTKPGPDSTIWRLQERRALEELHRWCQGDFKALEGQLRALADDSWLARQPVHVWAARIGSRPDLDKRRKRAGAASADDASEFEKYKNGSKKWDGF